MSTVQSAPVQIEPSEKTRLEIFISYASEDRPFVHTLVEELKVPFSILLHFFVDDRSIESGDEWKRTITDRLDTADILFIVSTGRPRESHDFPGFEIGYFLRSIKERPTAAGIKRQIVPLIIGGTIPGTVLDIQGIVIERKDIYNFEIPTENLSSETKFLDAIPADNPFKRFLLHLRDLVTSLSHFRLTDDDVTALNKAIDDCASRLYKRTFAYLQSLVCSELLPERKLIIRTHVPSAPLDEDAVLANLTIEFVGQSFELFGLPQRPPNLTWSKFVSTIAPAEIATQWKEGIRTLVFNALSGITGERENYHYLSLPAGRIFRLFVSLARTYCSGQKEIHIYIVERLPVRDYGDVKTSKLLKAIALGLRYRSLFLERDSPFSPQIMGFVLPSGLKSKVAELWYELQKVLIDARQSNLGDPALLSWIYGDGEHEKLDEVKVWMEAESNLNTITHEVTTASPDKVAAMKDDFMVALQNFCHKTDDMNQQYTSKALLALEEDITRRS